MNERSFDNATPWAILLILGLVVLVGLYAVIRLAVAHAVAGPAARWEVTGTDKYTGMEIADVVTARNEEEAVKLATRRNSRLIVVGAKQA